ncbi:hypothetical protein [Acinetobacter oleivorans]|uniref:hypothetical protein n=1 Tax=Acinetobacter oleivorans TaxID=1148157 RepID=UPI00157FC979|nr:hypothetical protein [Acinetobacter oleivorans]NUG02745.1 hypothetical protein [Acinetobacter oleivorans]
MQNQIDPINNVEQLDIEDEQKQENSGATMNQKVGFHTPTRPMPSEWLFEIDTPNFVPVSEMWDWIGSDRTC